MRRTLDVTPLTHDLLPLMRDFDCGDRPWEREVADWINGNDPYGAGHALREQRAEIWVYSTEQDGIVGFGSLGQSNWRWPLPDDPRVPINIIPAVGIAKAFYGEPKDSAPEDRFSSQILQHLIAQARRHTERQPLLGLFVHPQNVPAIRLYDRIGFQPFHQTFFDPESRVTYRGMILRLA